MDQHFSQFPNLVFDSNLDRHPVVNGSRFSDPFMELGFPSSLSSDGDSPSDDSDYSDSLLKYINQMLMEENMEAKPCMFHDPLALQATEKSLYEVLGEKYPPLPSELPIYSDRNVESPDDHSGISFSDSGKTSSSSSTCTSGQSFWSHVDPAESTPSILQNPIPANFVFQSPAQSSSNFLFNFANNGNEFVGSSVSENLVPNLFSESDLALQFQRGLEEGNKFLPKGNPLFINLENYSLSSEENDREHSPTGLKGRKNHEREEANLEDGRSNKQLAVYTEETELSDMFDKVLLCSDGHGQPPGSTADEANMPLQQGSETSNVKSRAKIQDSNKEVVDLRTLLISCAQAVSANDVRTATELIKQIRQHSSPIGDGSQRCAHFFANGLEARLAGTGSEIYAALASKRTSAADMLKAYQVYISHCPFKKVAIIFANHMICKVAEKAEQLHIIDFGILYGFQWPALIQCLSKRPGGPPKLRITGIELPQQGFRPAERVQETGNRLAKYCERYGVPFEYYAIAQKWETIQIEDIKIDKNEVVAVNCLFRFKNLLDESVVVNSPRNVVLKLIRKIHPDIFVHAITNGSYNAPFFVTRFREALFHFSSLFDMAEATLPSRDPMGLTFEREFIGRQAVNTIACEGTERVERPETYKQWQVRNTRAGFKQLPLDVELMKKCRDKVKSGYHSDFVVDEDGNWMLQGWKGRLLYASSCWVPA